MFRKIGFIFCMSLLCACIHSSGAVSAAPPDEDTQQIQSKWLKTSGAWTIQNGRAIETRIRPVYWNYHELMNFNTLTTKDVESDFTELTAKFGLTNTRIFPVEILLSFGVRSPEAHYYYDFFAVKLIGDESSITTASIIRSQRKDANLPLTAKNNYVIETLYTQDCLLKYNEEYEVKITKANNSKGATITLYIDNKRIFSQNLPIVELKEKGKFAVASRGASISIDYVTIKNGRTTVFNDDFSENTIFTPTVSATKTK